MKISKQLDETVRVLFIRRCMHGGKVKKEIEAEEEEMEQ